MPAHSEPELIELIQHILRPSGMRERIRLRISGGYTAMQIFQRLPAHMQALLVPTGTHPSQKESAGLSVLERTLKSLCQHKKIRRQSVNIQEQDGRGVRRLRLDVYRLY